MAKSISRKIRRLMCGTLKVGNTNPTPPVIGFKPKYGVLVNGDYSVDQKASITQELGCGYARMAITVQDWIDGDKTSNAYEAYDALGIKCIMNINWGHSPSPYVTPAELGDYIEALNEILDKYPPEIVVVENEPMNKNYHTGNIANYCTQLIATAAVCAERDIQCCDGGIYGTGLEILTHRWNVATGKQSVADDFAGKCMKPAMVKAANNPGSNANMEALVSEISAILDACVTAGCDFVNLHMYEDLSETDSMTVRAAKVDIQKGVIENIANYIKSRTNLGCITNETGQRDNTNPALVVAMLTEYARLGFKYVIWFSGEGSNGAKPLQTDTFVVNNNLLPNGKAFKSKILS